MNRSIRIMATMAAAFLLAGCPLEQKWVDTTGQDRNDNQFGLDYNACAKENGVPENGVVANEKEVGRRVLACMAAKGWKPIPLKSN